MATAGPVKGNPGISFFSALFAITAPDLFGGNFCSCVCVFPFFSVLFFSFMSFSLSTFREWLLFQSRAALNVPPPRDVPSICHFLRVFSAVSVALCFVGASVTRVMGFCAPAATG